MKSTKLGNDFRGDPSSALLEALDPEQNFNFSDHYLNVPFDLSKVLFICTANHLENIPGPLRDRLEIISLPGYTQQEKLAIARKYILPKEMHENGLKDRELTLPDAAMNRIIREYTREAGLRNLEREIGTVCRKIARRKAEGSKPPFRVTAAGLPRLLGAPIFIDDEAERKLIPGVALGLAWTPAGGEILYIEVSAIKGKGGLTLTGQLGDVMKESAQAALTLCPRQGRRARHCARLRRAHGHPYPCARRGHPQGWPLSRGYAGDGAHLRADRKDRAAATSA